MSNAPLVHLVYLGIRMDADGRGVRGVLTEGSSLEVDGRKYLVMQKICRQARKLMRRQEKSDGAKT